VLPDTDTNAHTIHVHTPFLPQVTAERDELERDVEQLCMSRGGHMFSSSYVLAQRLQFLEGEVKQQRLALRNVTTERDSLQEDMLQIRSSKRQADQVRGYSKLLPQLQ
jgi:hypothetical protein